MDKQRLKDLEMAAFNLYSELEDFRDTILDDPLYEDICATIALMESVWQDLEAYTTDNQ